MYTALENYTHLHIATVNKTKSHCMECNALALQVYKIYKCCLHPAYVIRPVAKGGEGGAAPPPQKHSGPPRKFLTSA